MLSGHHGREGRRCHARDQKGQDAEADNNNARTRARMHDNDAQDDDDDADNDCGGDEGEESEW